MGKVSLKKGLKYIPEILLLAFGVYTLLFDLIYSSSFSLINGIIIFGMITILTLLIWKNKYLAFYTSMILGFVSFYFLLALLSEFSEFPAGSKDGRFMLLIGSLIFGGLLIISIIMPIKYFKMRGKPNI